MSSFYDYRNQVHFVTRMESSGNVAMDAIHSNVKCNALDPDNCRYHKTGRFAKGKSNAFEPGDFDVGEVQDYLADLMTAHGVDGEMEVIDQGDGKYQAQIDLKKESMKDGMLSALSQFFKCKGVWTAANGYSIYDSLHQAGAKNYFLNFRMPNSPKAVAKTDVEKKDAGKEKAEAPKAKSVEKKAATEPKKAKEVAKPEAKAPAKEVAEKKETPKKAEKTAPKKSEHKKAADIPYENENSGDTDGDDDAVAPEPASEVPASKPKDDVSKGPSEAELAAIESENDDDDDGEIGSAAGEVSPNEAKASPVKQKPSIASYKDDDHISDAFWEQYLGSKPGEGEADEEEEDADANESEADTSPKGGGKGGFLSPDKPKSIEEMGKADAKQQKADIEAAKAIGENTEAKINPNADTHTKASENGGVFVCKSFEPAVVGKFEAGFQDDQKGKMSASGVSSADYTVGKQNNMHECLDFEKAQKAFTDSAQAVAASIKQIKQLALNGGTMGFQMDKAYELFKARRDAYEKAAVGLAKAGKTLTEKTQPIIASNGAPSINYPNSGLNKLAITRSPFEKGSIFDKMKVSTVGGASGTPSKKDSGTAEGATAENQPVVPNPDAPLAENKVTLNSEATQVHEHPKSEEPKPTALAKVAKSAETDTASSVLSSMKAQAKSPEVASYYDKAMKKLAGLVG